MYAWQGSLFAAGTEVAPRDFSAARRRQLGDGAWVEYVPGWLGGADQLVIELIDAIPWRAERRRMYEREVEVPRLVASYTA